MPVKPRGTSTIGGVSDPLQKTEAQSLAQGSSPTCGQVLAVNSGLLFPGVTSFLLRTSRIHENHSFQHLCSRLAMAVGFLIFYSGISESLCFTSESSEQWRRRCAGQPSSVCFSVSPCCLVNPGHWGEVGGQGPLLAYIRCHLQKADF